MRFKVDENVPLEVAQLLTEAGHDAHTVTEEELEGAHDPQLMSVCREEHRALITLDAGFGDIRSYPPDDSYGILVLRPRSQDKPALL